MTIYSLVILLFPILNQSIVPCPILTVASWPANRFFRRQVRLVWYSHLLKNFPQFVVIHTFKGFSVVNETEGDVFLEFFCFFYDPMEVGNLISFSSAFSKFNLNIWSSRFTYCWSLAWQILSITFLVCEMTAIFGSLNILWHSLSLGLEWKLTFSSPVATAEFSRFAGILSAALS